MSSDKAPGHGHHRHDDDHHQAHDAVLDALRHDHVFLGANHTANERRTWAVIVLCAAMMVVEVVGGVVFHSMALLADGIHMATHAGAMLIAAAAYFVWLAWRIATAPPITPMPSVLTMPRTRFG